MLGLVLHEIFSLAVVFTADYKIEVGGGLAWWKGNGQGFPENQIELWRPHLNFDASFSSWQNSMCSWLFRPQIMSYLSFEVFIHSVSVASIP